MCTGKVKCEILRRIRQNVADKYGLHYTSTECKHKGDCSGTCPKCDAELEDLQRQLASRGIDDVDLLNIPIESSESNDFSVLQGDIQAPDDYMHTIGLPAPPLLRKEDTSNLIRVMEFCHDEYDNFVSDLNNKGCVYFRFGGFPPWEHTLPKKGEKVIFMYKEEQSTLLYLMHCIAVGDDDARYFVEDNESLHFVDDCCYYVFTNCKGPISVKNEQLDFLESEYVNSGVNPENFLSESATSKLIDIIERESC